MSATLKLVDVHCHLESSAFATCLDEVIAEAESAGLVKLITNAITPPQWPVSQALAEKYPMVECALGVHPWYGSLDDVPALDGLLAARDRGAVALGEFGLDRKTERVPWAVQTVLFERQLRIARTVDLPVILHCRGAYNELLGYLKTIGLPSQGGVIHNYTGSAEMALDLARYGMCFSIGGVLTYHDTAKRTRLLHAIYPDRFLLETDSPDIPPIPCRGKPNVPANIRYNLEAAARILGESVDRVADTTTRNAQRIFGLAIPQHQASSLFDEHQ